jgi:broad specificity phosphatase PhoE
VDQIYKDFTSAIINAYKFFETYAKVDNFVYDKPRIYFLRHGEANKGTDPELTKDSVTAMQDPAFIERVLRVNPDVIYSSPLLRAQQTAQRAQEIMKTYRGKDIKIIIDKNLEEGPTTMKSYETIMAKEG